MYDNAQAQPQTVMEAAEAGPRCALCGFPAPDRRRWANLGLIGLWKFGTPRVPLCWVCSQFFVHVVQIKDVVLGHLRRNGIQIGVPSSAQVAAATGEQDLGPPPGMPQGAEQ